MASSRIDPDATYRYFLEIDGISSQLRVKEVSGLKMSTKVAKHREGGKNSFEVSLVEGQVFEPLTLKRGFFSKEDTLFQWMRELHAPGTHINRKTISIVMLQDEEEKEICRYNLFGAFIAEYEGPSFDSEAKSIGFETIKIQYDFFEYAKA